MNRVLQVILIATFAAPALVLAQTDPHYTHFTFNKVLINPAYAGASSSFCLNAISHQQYRGLEDQTPSQKTQKGDAALTADKFAKNIAPKTTGFAFYAPINIKNKTTLESKNYGGVYLGMVSDVIAYEKNTYLRGGFAVAYPFDNGASLRLGFDFVSLSKQLDADKLRAHDPNDPNIPSGKPGDTKTNFGAGIYYQNPNAKNFYVGFSASNINTQIYNYGAPNQAQIKIATARHFYLMSGVKLENFLGNPALTLDPAILIKTVNNKAGFVKPELDLQGMLTFNSLYAAGLNLRSYGAGFDALAIMIGYYPPIKGNSADGNSKQTLRVGYSYDITLSSLTYNSNGTHELQVNYCFKIQLPVKTYVPYRHPRYMQRKPDIE